MSTKISFDLPDFSLVLKNATASTLQEAGFKVEDEAKKAAPVDSGYYRNNIGFDGKNKVIANADYSADLEYGTKPHVIEPKTAKALHFKSDGQDVFTKRVKHPGTKPLAIMRNAALKVQKQVGGMFYDNFRKDLKNTELRMFEQLLFEYIKENFKVDGFNLSFGYGEIHPKTKEPYIIQYSLGMDGTRQVLCNEDNYTDGESFTQWNIYTGSQSTADFIYQQLFTFVEGIKQLGDYKIGLNQYNSSRAMTNPDIGLYSSILAMQIQYYQ